MSSGDPQATPVRIASPGAPPQIVIQQQSSAFGRYGKWLLTALIVAVMAAVTMYSRYQSYFTPPDMPQERYHSLSKYATKKIAIIDISGAIMEGPESFAKRQIDRVREDEDVVAVVLRINSPGGTVTGSDYLLHHLRELATANDRKLPIVASMGSVCASGGYYVAMAVGSEPNSIYAEPTTWTGSIGVIIPHFDLSGTLDKIGVADDSIASGKFKQMGTPTRPMTEEDRKLLQGLVDDSFKGFKAVVTSGRPVFKDDPAALDAVATGQIFTANQALERKLVDKIGFLEDAISAAVALSGLSAEEVRCVQYRQAPTFFGQLMGSESHLSPRGSVDLAALLDLAAPRAYYLWTWLPAAMSNSR